ncbi:hypothetical protein BLNAU_4596 [Blattamonas nauphoetae]|uniref:Uncharacterized protein n=1 Tax=Blattamonas nauphoetae TaxID=2049346 RepID=A0ABQ9Y9P8_9EUKA|nr:hypothetical protein BLNAU_4596 [Blattamonas nauphoetae]
MNVNSQLHTKSGLDIKEADSTESHHFNLIRHETQLDPSRLHPSRSTLRLVTNTVTALQFRRFGSSLANHSRSFTHVIHGECRVVAGADWEGDCLDVFVAVFDPKTFGWSFVIVPFDARIDANVNVLVMHKLLCMKDMRSKLEALHDVGPVDQRMERIPADEESGTESVNHLHQLTESQVSLTTFEALSDEGHSTVVEKKRNIHPLPSFSLE